jgi:hypothetical protein
VGAWFLLYNKSVKKILLTLLLFAFGLQISATQAHVWVVDKQKPTIGLEVRHVEFAAMDDHNEATAHVQQCQDCAQHCHHTMVWLTSLSGDQSFESRSLKAHLVIHALLRSPLSDIDRPKWSATMFSSWRA